MSAVPKIIDYEGTVERGNGEYESVEIDFDQAKDYLGLKHKDVAELFGIKSSTLSSSTARHRYRKAFAAIVSLTFTKAKSQLNLYE